jgi:putative flippase GtrA
VPYNADRFCAQGIRYVGVGGFVTVVYVALTTLLSQVLGVPFGVAVTAGYFTAVAVHYCLHRWFVFATDAGYALGMTRQVVQFVALVILQYVLTAASVAFLPELLGLPRFVVWIGTVALLVPAAFVIMRSRLFHPPAAVVGG